jgi:NosR/NirI family nitrous oxide reductase transcriptional regulator
VIRTKFRKGGMIMGGFIGLALGITLMNQVVFRRREDYEPHKGDCFSCGRCMDYCPVDKPEPEVKRLKLVRVKSLKLRK